MILFASSNFLSMQNFTFKLSLSLSRAKGLTEPFATPNFSIKSSSSPNRRLAPGRFKRKDRSFKFTSVAASTVTRKKPCFLSLLEY